MTEEMQVERINTAWVLRVICLGIFMVNLDMTIVNVVLPSLARVFSAHTSALSHVLLAYLLCEIALLLPFGRLGDLKGIKRVFVAGFVVFTAASLLCGLSRTLNELVLFRFVQGVGGAMMFSVVLAFISVYFPPAERMRAMGFATMSAALGVAVGPTLGGWLAGWWSWRLIFLVNVPLGLLAIPLACKYLPRDHPKGVPGPFDWAGALLSTTSIVLLIAALNTGDEMGWRSLPILGSFAGALCCGVAFFIWQTRASTPLVAPVFFLDRNLVLLWSTFGLSLMTVGGMMFIFPFLAEDYMGISSAWTGMAMMVVAFGQFVGPWAGDLAKRFGAHRICLLGLLAGAASFVGFLWVGEPGGLALAVVALSVLGLSQGLNKGLNIHLIMLFSPDDQKGVAGSLSALVRSLALALGVVVFETVFSRFVPLVHGSLRPHSHLLLKGFQVVFMLGLLISVAAFLAMLFVRKRKQADGY